MPRDSTGPRSAGQRFYRPELDGLRFFAFLAVYVEHTLGSSGLGTTHHRLPNWLGELVGAISTAGNFGVDLFFVLSSYLITELLLRERGARGRLDVKAFYIRRMLRIWPLYFFFVALAYGLSLALASEALTWKHVLAYLLFVGNWMYFLAPVTTVAGPLWSVSLEEQFYLIWPWVVRRLDLRHIAYCAGAMMVLAAVVSVLLTALQPQADWVSKNSFTRIDGIAVGALLALGLQGRIPALSAALRAVLLAASIALLLWVAYAFGLFQPGVGLLAVATGWPLAAVACGGVLLSALGSSGRWTAPLRGPVLVYLGRISYGLYVYHELVLKVAAYWLPQQGASIPQMLAYMGLGLAGTIPIAAASYRWLELPFLRLKRERFTMVLSRPD